jgi:cytidine deaminase
LVTRDGGMPCGMCLQALSEFAADPSAVMIFVRAESGDTCEFTLAQLLPCAFRSETVA